MNLQWIFRRSFFFFLIFGSASLVASPRNNANSTRSSISCHELWENLIVQYTFNESPILIPTLGTKTMLAKALEKEGLFYSEIAHMFPSVNPENFKSKLQARLNLELAEKAPRKLIRFLEKFDSGEFKALDFYYPGKLQKPAFKKSSLSPQDILNELTRADANPFDKLSMEAKEDLFFDSHLNFNDLIADPDMTPKDLAVGDDDGSYEVKSKNGIADLRRFQEQRTRVEDQLDGPIGHQHFVHAWPQSAATRKEMAPHYVSALDTLTWYHYWSQAKRNPEVISSIVDHPFLGVYTQASLDRLHEAVETGDPKKFKNKFRMIGARFLPGDPQLPGQIAGKFYPDWERRSGNKAHNAHQVDRIMESLLGSGDFSRFPDFRSFNFNPSAPLTDLVSPHLKAKEVEELLEFERNFKYMKWSADPRALNHYRNRITAPLLPWRNRLGKLVSRHLEEEQKKYAQALLNAARSYKKYAHEARSPDEINALYENVMDEIRTAQYNFEDEIKLHLAFEKALQPIPRAENLPNISVKSRGSIDVNKIPIGIELSGRFPTLHPNKEDAMAHIQETAQALAEKLGGTVKEMDTPAGSHGHGLSVRSVVTDSKGQDWRLEWDGIQRFYRQGKAYSPHNGHIEIPTPKFTPQSAQEFVPIFETMRAQGIYPIRKAGGGHFNVDLNPLKVLAPKEGAQKMRNFINYFESNQIMISFLWQHPNRIRTAAPIDLHPELIRKLNEFDGDWEALGKVLYSEKYFNTGEWRKPVYVQNNLAALMNEQVPEAYKRKIDIKKPNQRWFPSFGGKGLDRFELRLFDAPENERVAALMVKYVRALLNRTWNSPEPILLKPKYTPARRLSWGEDPQLFWQEAEAHFKDLGLDPKEFQGLAAEAIEVQKSGFKLEDFTDPRGMYNKQMVEEEEEDMTNFLRRFPVQPKGQ